MTTTTRSTRAQIALEAGITAVIAFVLSLPVLGPLLSRIDDGWGGGDMLSTYVNAYVWGGIRFSVSDQFGFPLAMNLNYFPTSDITQNLFALVVNTLTGGTFTGINVLIVLSFPLVAALAYVVIRMTGLKGALAIALAVAFTFIPFHWGRSLGHTYLATLYSAVVGIGLVLAIGSGAFSRLATQSDRRRRVWFWVVIAVMILVIAWSGIYYTAFTLILGVAALLWRFAHRATWRTLGREVLPFVAIGFLAVAGVVPSLLTTRGDPPLAQLAERLPYESVIFAGNLAMALLPLPQSQLPGMESYNRRVVEAIQAAPYGEATVITNHGTWVTSLALLVFIIGLIMRARRPQPVAATAGERSSTRVTITYIAYLTFVTLLFFIPWGLNYLLAGTVTAQIRAWNRLLPILLLLFILGAAAALAKTRIAQRASIAIPIAVVVLALTLIDAVLPFRSPYSDSVARGSELSDAGRQYSSAVQGAIPEQCGVLQLPYMGYPEYGVVGGVNDYDHFWTSITNPGKQWSYGAVKFTDASIWMSQLPQVPTDEQVSLMRALGFCAIHLDTRGYISEQLVPVQQDLQSRFGAPVATALDGDWEMYDIRNAPAASEDAAQAFLRQPFIEVDYNTSTLRDSLMQQSWWWTRDNVALIDLVPTSTEWPVTGITGAIAAPQCGPVPVTVTLTAGDEQVMTTVLAKPGDPAPFDLSLQTPAKGTAILTIDTPGEGCPEGDRGERRFAQVLDLQPR